MNTAQGSFEVDVKFEPPYESDNDIVLARAHVDKTFTGPLTATSSVQMLSVRNMAQSSGAYVAIERIRGSLDGKRGSFVVYHLGTAERSAQRLQIGIVPDTGTEELTGIRGEVSIRIEGGQHYYEVKYELPASL